MQLAQNLPKSFQKIVVHTLNNDFVKATRIENVELHTLVEKMKKGQVILRYEYVGINASDINFTAGRYDPAMKPPFDCGFEAVGTVVCTREGGKFKIGQAVGVMTYGCFAEYQIVSERHLIPLPTASDQFLPLLVSGLTSFLALKHHGRMTHGETVLITAAAGGAGQIAVQLAKLAGNHVIGTCSTGKEDFLRSIGCDRVVNYKKEDLKSVLKKEYPRGVDIVFESVGSEMFKTCFNALSIKGRLIVIGSVSNYAKPTKDNDMGKFVSWEQIGTQVLLGKSTTVTGFFLNHYADQFASTLSVLTQLVSDGKLKPCVHRGDFSGMKGIYKAVETLHSGKNAGKLVVKLGAPNSKL